MHTLPLRSAPRNRRASLRCAAALLCAAGWLSACGAEPAAPPPAPPRPAALHAEIAFATYWGSQGGSALRSVVFDAAGNLYVVGGTTNPGEWPQTQPANGPLGFFDVIVAKFASDGQNLWSRVLGGSGEDYAYVAALDAAGNLVVGGRAGPLFPVTSGAYDTSFAGGQGKGPHGPTDGFLLSLSPAGELRWATYIGSAGDDVTRALEILPDGGIAAAGGNTTGADLPVTPGVLKARHGGDHDVWLGVLEPDGSRMRFLSYFGPNDDTGNGDETLRTIGLAPDGTLWIGGTTQGSDLAASPDAFQPQRGAKSEAFVARVAPDGQRMPYFSWLGASGDENIETEGFADASGALLIAGGASSSDFPATPGAERGSVAGEDGMVARIEADGRLGMAARFGGSARENFFGPALTEGGSLLAAGTTTSHDLPVTQGAPQPAFGGGGSDSVLAAFDRAGALELSTYYGGSGQDACRFVAADNARGRIAIVGETTSTDLPLKNAAQAEPGAVFLVVYELKRVAEKKAPPATQAPAAE